MYQLLLEVDILRDTAEKKGYLIKIDTLCNKWRIRLLPKDQSGDVLFFYDEKLHYVINQAMIYLTYK